MGTKRDSKPFYDEEAVIGGAVTYHREWCRPGGMIGPSRKRLSSGDALPKAQVAAWEVNFEVFQRVVTFGSW